MTGSGWKYFKILEISKNGLICLKFTEHVWICLNMREERRERRDGGGSKVEGEEGEN